MKHLIKQGACFATYRTLIRVMHDISFNHSSAAHKVLSFRIIKL